MNIFLASDLHLSHRNIVKFTEDDGVTPLRPWDNIDEMNEALIGNWNRVVRPQDKVYNLGDVMLNKSSLHLLGRLNGTQILIGGNHDVQKMEDYAKYFSDIRGCHSLDGFLLSHIPIHPDSIGRWNGNYHGHLHSGKVMKNENEIDKRYMCVSMEQINFTPIAFEDAKIKFESQ